VNIKEPDPFANRITKENANTAANYAYASVDRAIELIKDPELIEHNLAVMPGITTPGLTSKLVDTCAARADSLAIIDLPDIYLPPHEKKCSKFSDRIATTPDTAAKTLRARQINSSYGASYYPWVKVRDDENGRDLWAPPSVIALGVMAYTEQRDEVWFAPAGFNRGGLNEGNAGLPVLQVSEQLLSKQRDTLYEANINPIASFVTEGLVVFGQKTLQSAPSALDRINVRRLLIFVKKEISRIANGLLFDQNVPATWNRFLGQVNPFLQSVQTRLGLSDYKVILDNTTTTPDLVDRNVMYAKIFLKPARAIEFIAVDFVITNTGASFDD
jgi:phage tail sheath protein FI